MFKVEREAIDKKTGKLRRDYAFGITSAPESHSTPKQILKDNRSHWSIESCHYIIDWNYDEDRSQIRKGFGPENITRLRRFAIGLLKSKQVQDTIPVMMKKLLLNTRAVFDFLKLSGNSNPRYC